MITGCSSLPIKKNEWIQSGKSTGMNRRRNDRSRRFFPTGAGGEETRTNIKSGEQYRKPNNLPFENCTSPWYFWKYVPPSPPITHEKKNYRNLVTFVLCSANWRHWWILIIMSSYRRLDCAYKCWDRIPRMQLSCDILGKTQAIRQNRKR